MTQAPGNPAEILKKALALHNAGQLGEAADLYQSVLAADAENADALHLMGVLSTQAGNPELGADFITRAIARNGDAASYHASLGEALAALDQAENAVAAYEKAISLNPEYEGALNNLALLYQKLGRHADAVNCLERAVAVRPDAANLLINLGRAQRLGGDADAAGRVLRRALAQGADDIANALTLAQELKDLGATGDAIAAFRRAVELDPDSADALNNLGNLLAAEGSLEEAAGCYRKARKLSPDTAEIHNNLGNALRELGDVDGAKASFAKAIKLKPGYAEAHNNLAIVLELMGEMDEAAAHLQRAVDLEPGSAGTWFNLGTVLKGQNQDAGAKAAFTRALEIDPGFLRARWALALDLPVIHESEERILQARAQWTEGLRAMEDAVRLDGGQEISEAARAVAAYTNFFLHYQGHPDRDLQEAYGRLISRIAAAAFPGHVTPPARREAIGKIRVGIASAHFFSHTVCRLFGGWVRELDRAKFEVHVFHAGERRDAFTEAIARSSDGFHTNIRSGERLVGALAGAGLDVIIYPDMGMVPWIQLAAALRLAPVQCCTFGHPVTSGLAAIDYFLSGELMEPADGDSHYSETLIRLPNLGIHYPCPDVGAAVDSGGLLPPAAAGRTRYLCAQSLFKLLPRYDGIFARIAQQDPNAVFLFIAHPSAHVTDCFRARLARVFSGVGLDADAFCHFLPRLDLGRFYGLTRDADVILDSPNWSGGNTMLEAFSFAKPVVTLPGPLMRGRVCHAMLLRMGVPDTVAADEAAYVDIAVRLGTDPAWREAIQEKLAGARDLLFDDPDAVRGLEQFLSGAVSKG